MSSSLPDSDSKPDQSWVTDIRGPQYFDFCSATTFPCTSSVDNPPLRDELYESDDETRTFFETLLTDPQYNISGSKDDQKNSVSIDKELIRKAGPPRYRHRPSTTFEEYLAQFNEQKETKDNTPKSPARPNRSSQLPQSNEIQTPPSTPRAQLNQSRSSTRTPGASPFRSRLRTPTARRPRRQVASSSQDVSLEQAINQLSLDDSVPTPTRNGSAAGRPAGSSLRLPERKASSIATLSPRFNRSTTASRSDSTSGHPSGSSLTSLFSKSSGARRVAKSRSYIDQDPNLDNNPSNLAKSKLQTSETVKASEKGTNDSGDNRSSKLSWHLSGTSDEIEQDDELMKMMEEHNKRLNGTMGKKSMENLKNVNNTTGNQKEKDLVSSKSTGILSKRRQFVSVSGKSLTKHDEPTKENESQSKSTKNTSDHLHLQNLGDSAASKVRSSQTNPDNQVGPKRFVPRRAQDSVRGTDSRKEPQDRVADGTDGSESPGRDQNIPSQSLEDILQSENMKLLREREKKEIERQKTNRADRDSMLRKFEDERGFAIKQDQKRISARVAFTAAEVSSTRAVPIQRRIVSNTTETKISGINKIRKTSRQNTDLLSKSTMLNTRLGSNRTYKAGNPSTVNRNKRPGPIVSSDKKSATWTARIKAVDQKKRMEKRMDNDLKSILSQHNNRVQKKRQNEKAAPS